MNEQMEFPETFEKFAEYYGFKDDQEVYTNGSDLIQIFRVKQWLEHDNKLRAIETDTAYECGKHANKWIPTNERQPKENGNYLALYRIGDGTDGWDFMMVDHCNAGGGWLHEKKKEKVIAWMPLPTPYKAESEECKNDEN